MDIESQKNEITNDAELTQDEKNFGMLCHLSALSGFIVPMASLVAPLIIWLLKREESAFVDRQGKEAVNFQISFLIYAMVCCLLMFVLVGFVLLPILAIFGLIVIILGAMAASKGEDYRYPFSIRFIK